MEEPKRKSFLDVLKKTFSLTDRLAFTTRFVYIGEYRGSKDSLQKKFKQNVKEINEEYGDGALTGILLLYPTIFLHLIEGSEETIYRHLDGVLPQCFDKILECVIPLPAYHNVYKMYFSDWYVVYIANPPVLLDKIEITELDEIQKQIKNCLSKIYLLSEYLMTAGCGSYEKTNEALKSLSRVVPYYLPEVTIVEYLLSLKSPVLEDLQNYIKKFKEIPFINFYNDRIWPPAYGLVPHTFRFDQRQRQRQA